MPRRLYVGPIKAIVTKLDGVELTLERGESVDVSVDQAKRLDEDNVNWATPKKAGGSTPPDKKDGDS